MEAANVLFVALEPNAFVAEELPKLLFEFVPNEEEALVTGVN